MKGKNTIPYIIAPKNIKYFGIQLTKNIQDLYAKNYKILMKKARGELNKWRDIFCYELEESAWLKECQFSPNSSTGLMQLLRKYQQSFP